jgi:hypothetical protein
VREAERATPAAHAAALGLQRAAGNRAASAVLGGRDLTRPAGATLSRGAFDALKKGGQMYLGMDDAGAPFARELMRWRLVGLGAEFTKTQADGDWNRFMQDRPEIQLAMVPVLEKVALKAAADGPAPKVLGLWQPDREYKETIRGVLLNELESMRLTLHGCHRIDIQILASVKADGADTIVQMVVTMTWVDVADLHPGTATELEGGELVDDKEFTAAGWDYPIAITFTADGYSTWRVNGGVAAHERGWPPVTGVPKGGFRG